MCGFLSYSSFKTSHLFWGRGGESTKLQFMDPMNSYLAIFVYTESKTFPTTYVKIKKKKRNLPPANFSDVTIKITSMMAIYFNSMQLKKPKKFDKNENHVSQLLIELLFHFNAV